MIEDEEKPQEPFEHPEAELIWFWLDANELLDGFHDSWNRLAAHGQTE